MAPPDRLLMVVPLLLLLLVLSCAPPPVKAKFYIGRFKSAPVPATDNPQARSMPYIVHPGEAGSETLMFNKRIGNNQWRIQQPPRSSYSTHNQQQFDNIRPSHPTHNQRFDNIRPNYPSHNQRFDNIRPDYPSHNQRFDNIGPATNFGLTNNYGNDKYKGYSIVKKDEVKYVIPPFTPGGRVHVAFQFWVPISVGGFFVSSRDLEAALKSESPTAYLTSLFLHHLATNTSAAPFLEHVDANTIQEGIEKFLSWVLPYYQDAGSKSFGNTDFYQDEDSHSYSSTDSSQEADVTSHSIIHSYKHKVNASKPNDKISKRKRLRRNSTDKEKRKKRQVRKKRSADIVRQSLLEHTKQGLNERSSRDSTQAPEERSTRTDRDSEDGWVTIGGPVYEGNIKQMQPTSPLLTQATSGPQQQQVPNDRLLWGINAQFSHNSLQNPRPGDHQSDLDFTSPIDYPYSRPSSSRPSTPSIRPSSSRPIASSARPTHSRFPTPRPSTRPPFHLNSFDDLASGVVGGVFGGGGGGTKGLDVGGRLSRLDYFFSNLHLEHEDCRRRVLCEVSRDQDIFSPLSDMISSETRLPGKVHEVSRQLLSSAEGARLLSYVEAVKVGEERDQACDVFHYRCRVRAREVINIDILPIWREVVRWLTVKVLSQDTSLV